MEYVKRLGFSNVTQDGKYILLLDSDIGLKRYADMKKVLRKLQSEYSLSDFYIISTKCGFHAICLDKLIFADVMLIYRDFVKYGFGDKAHCNISEKRNKHILAIDNDKKAFDVVVSQNRNYQRSNAHRLLLNMVYGFNIKYDCFFDNFTVVEFEIFDKGIK